MKLKQVGSNMTELEVNGKVVLFSYQTPVAYKSDVGTCYRTSQKWSSTTSRHINKWLAGREAVIVDQSYIDRIVSN